MLTITRLHWTDWNIQHIGTHAVTPAEVEEVCFGAHVAVETRDGRTMLIAPVATGRMLAVVVKPDDERPAAHFVLSARDAAPKERRVHRLAKGGVAA